MSKNKDEFDDLEYISCYKKRAKGQLIGMKAVGWGGAILLFISIFRKSKSPVFLFCL